MAAAISTRGAGEKVKLVEMGSSPKSVNSASVNNQYLRILQGLYNDLDPYFTRILSTEEIKQVGKNYYLLLRKLNFVGWPKAHLERYNNICKVVLKLKNSDLSLQTRIDRLYTIQLCQHLVSKE